MTFSQGKGSAPFILALDADGKAAKLAGEEGAQRAGAGIAVLAAEQQDGVVGGALLLDRMRVPVGVQRLVEVSQFAFPCCACFSSCSVRVLSPMSRSWRNRLRDITISAVISDSTTWRDPPRGS